MWLIPRLEAFQRDNPDIDIRIDASDVAVDPSHSDTVYVATHGGGVWRSDDGGATWTLPGDEMTSRQVNWVLADPGKSTTVWAGVEDAGLWRSLDKGATWKSVRPNDDQVTGARITFAPTQPASIWVPSTNLHHRSADGGKTWSEFRVGNQDAYAIAVSPNLEIEGILRTMFDPRNNLANVSAV